MPPQKYIWLAALSMVALRLHQNNKNDPPVSPQSLTDVTGIAGTLCHHVSPPANDSSVAMCIIVLDAIQNCAKKNANMGVFTLDYCKLTGRQFFAALALIALLIQASALSEPLSWQCQKDHLPTGSSPKQTD